jgi:hypothetical protein
VVVADDRGRLVHETLTRRPQRPAEGDVFVSLAEADIESDIADLGRIDH